MLIRVFYILLFILYNINLYAKTNVAIHGDIAYHPYVFSNDGKPDGIYVKILEKAFAQLEDYNVEIKLLPWKEGLDKLKSGEIFGLFPPYYWPKQRPYMDPYSYRLLDEEIVVVCREYIKSQKLRKNYPKDYKDLKFGNNKGFLTAGKEFFEMVEKGEIHLEEYSTTGEILKKLWDGDLDCYTTDRTVFLWEMIKIIKNRSIYESKYYHNIVEVAKVRSNESYIGYSKISNVPYKEDFIAKLDKILEKMYKSGEFKKILDDYVSRR